MIWVTRLNGSEVVLNADLIETVESTPDTVITLVDGKKYVVSEPAAEIIDRVRAFRVSILAASDHPLPAPEAAESKLYVLPSGDDEHSGDAPQED